MNRYNVLLDSSNISCKPNSILSSQVFNYLTRNGHTIVRNPSFADYIFINTCGFDDKNEGITTALYEAYRKKRKDGAKIVSIGCLNLINVSLQPSWPELLFISDLSALDDIFYNTVRYSAIDEAYLDEGNLPLLAASSQRAYDAPGKASYQVGEAVKYLGKKLAPGGMKTVRVIEKMHSQNRFYVEIGRGCVSQCSYCIIKKARGKLHSRGIDQILKDIETSMVPDQKLCLVADDCGCYGFDIGETIFSLVRAIHQEHPSLEIDLCYVNPAWLEKHEEEYVALFREVPISGVNIPVQTGSDRVVTLMNRKYGIENVRRIVGRLREASPRTVIYTHIIVGFPGEEEADFEKTLPMIELFDFLLFFAYSDREGTPSASMDGKVPERVKKRRLRKVRLKIYQELFKMVARDFSGAIMPAGRAKSLSG